MITNIPLNILQTRREKLDKLLVKNSLFILAGNTFIARNADVDYPFRQNSNFWYLTGLDFANCFLLIKKDNEGQTSWQIFSPDRDFEAEKWLGKGKDLTEIKSITGIKQTYFNFQFLSQLKQNLTNISKVYWDFNETKNQFGKQIQDLVFNNSRRSSYENLETFTKPAILLKQLRMYKDKWEIEQMQKATEITIKAHKQAILNLEKAIAKNKVVYEYQVEADLYHTFNKYGCTWSYPAIVASGANGVILHYTNNNSVIKKGDLLLIDSGSEYNYYASDITRTYPVGGKFSTSQKLIYDLVLSCNEQIIKYLQTQKATYNSFHQRSVEIITQGLMDIGFLKGSLEENINNQSYKQFYMHGIGHHLGLDVHDLGQYLDLDGKRSNIALTKNMIVTVEPGIYISLENTSVPKEFRGIAVRIEDNVLITKNSAIVLTKKLDK